MKFCAMAGYDNNTPYDCKFAGEKQGSQEQCGGGATPMSSASKKKITVIVSRDLLWQILARPP